MLTDITSQHLTETQNGQQACITGKELKDKYSQLQFHNETAKQCSFNFICGESTSIYSFKAVFFGLTDMLAEFQKAMNYLLIGLQSTYCFLDYNIIVSTVAESDQINTDCVQIYQNKCFATRKQNSRNVSNSTTKYT